MSSSPDVLFLPIELLEERYSKQWYHWFMDAFDRAGLAVQVIGDVSVEHEITHGEFLDAVQTHKFKLQQLQQLISYISTHAFEGTVFFMDMWFPGIEALAYIRQALGLHFKLVGILHAGTWDPHDYLTQCGMYPWAHYIEQGWFVLADRLLVATAFHKELILSHVSDKRLRQQLEAKIICADFPVYNNPQLRDDSVKEDWVVFPHRLAAEKNLKDFELVQELYGKTYPQDSVQWKVSKRLCTSKRAYYELLAKSKVVFSAARQETFGIAMLEAVALGCYPVAPKRLSYEETLQEFPLYTTLAEAVQLVHKGLHEIRHQNIRCRYSNRADALVACVKAGVK